MLGIAASRFLADGADRVIAAIRTDRHIKPVSLAYVGDQILHRWCIGDLFLIFQRPLLFGNVDFSEITEAQIHSPVLIGDHPGEVGLGRRDLLVAAFTRLRPLLQRLNFLARLGQFVGLAAQQRDFVAQARQFPHLSVLKRRDLNGLGGVLRKPRHLRLQRRSLRHLLPQGRILLAQGLVRFLLHDSRHCQDGDCNGAHDGDFDFAHGHEFDDG
jgi:hypothetical protein